MLMPPASGGTGSVPSAVGWASPPVWVTPRSWARVGIRFCTSLTMADQGRILVKTLANAWLSARAALPRPFGVGRFDEPVQQGVAIARRRVEFGVELTGNKPWMIFEFDHLY